MLTDCCSIIVRLPFCCLACARWFETSKALIAGFLDEKFVSHSIPLLDSSTNLFRNLILPLATINEIVMHMLLAVSALSLAATGHTQYYSLALRHKQRAMRLIREQIAFDAISAANDANVIVILMLCVFEVSIFFFFCFCVFSD